MRPFAGLLALTLLWLPAAPAQRPVATYIVERPTILAFFPPVSEADLARDADTNEALGDFQLYAMQVGSRLKRAGIDFEVVSATKFKVKVGKNVRTFTSGKVNIGYYFVMPGKQALIRYGVMTDDDILESAAKYFGMKIGS